MEKIKISKCFIGLKIYVLNKVNFVASQIMFYSFRKFHTKWKSVTNFIVLIHFFVSLY